MPVKSLGTGVNNQCGVVPVADIVPVAPVACQAILEPGVGQLREFESR